MSHIPDNYLSIDEFWIEQYGRLPTPEEQRTFEEILQRVSREESMPPVLVGGPVRRPCLRAGRCARSTGRTGLAPSRARGGWPRRTDRRRPRPRAWRHAGRPGGRMILWIFWGMATAHPLCGGCKFCGESKGRGSRHSDDCDALEKGTDTAAIWSPRGSTPRWS